MKTSEPMFPQRLLEARNLRQLDQSACGKACGLPASSISHFEAGRRDPSRKNLVKLAVGLNVSADFLLGLKYVPDGSSGRDLAMIYYNGLPAHDQLVVMRILEAMTLVKEGNQNTPV